MFINASDTLDTVYFHKNANFYSAYFSFLTTFFKNSYHSIFSSILCNLRFPKFVLTVLIATDQDQSSTSD